MNNELSMEVAGYAEFLTALKERIQRAQLRAGLAVNRELVLLYWQIGCDIYADLMALLPDFGLISKRTSHSVGFFRQSLRGK